MKWKYCHADAMEAVIMTTSSAVSDDNFVNMMTFPFQFWKCQACLIAQPTYILEENKCSLMSVPVTKLLIHCGQMTLNRDTDRDQHWLK